MRLLGFLGAFPQKFIVWAAIIGMAFTLGMYTGNRNATERALTRELQASADRQRENHRQLLAWTKETERKLKADAEQQRAADKAAYDVLVNGKANSDRIAQQARAALAKARDEQKTLEIVQQNKLAEVRNELANQGPSDPGCVLSSGVRNALNSAIASINAHPVIGDTAPHAPGVPDGAYSSTTVLPCSELAAGVVNILEHDAMLTAWILSFQAWEMEIAR